MQVCVCEAGVCNHRRAELRGNRVALHLSVRVPVRVTEMTLVTAF